MIIKTIILTENPDFLSCLSDCNLDKYGMSIKTTSSFDELIKEIKENQYLLVSLSLGKHNKEQIHRQIKEIRSLTIVPVAIFAEELLDVSYKINVLNEGVDQFYQLPMGIEEIAVSSLALIRRFTEFNSVIQPVSIVYSHGLIISVDNRKVFITGKEIELVRKEFDILFYLVRNKGLVLTYEQIFQNVWGMENLANSKDVVTKQIYMLRRKIQIDDKLPDFIKTIHGIGYSFDPQYNES